MASSRRSPWQTKAPLSRARLGACVLATDQLVYLIGGLDGRGMALDSVELYSNQLNRWYPGPSLPAARYCAAAVLHDRHLWVLGGFTGMDRIPTATAFVWEHASNQWRSGPPLPEGRGGHVAGVWASELYVAGGKTVAGVSYDFLRYRSNLTQWEQLEGVKEWDHVETMPTACELAAGGVTDHTFLVVGGRNGTEGTGNVSLYDEQAGWRSGEPMSQPRWGAAHAVFGSFLLVAGGVNGQQVFNTVDAYDMLTNQWIRLPALPHPVHGAAGAVIGTTFYVIGGGGESGVSFTNQVFTLDLARTPLVGTGRSAPAKQSAPAYTGEQPAGRRTMPY